MTSVTQHQGVGSQEVYVSGMINNLQKVNTKSGKPMATFTIDTIPAKCFDLNVELAWQALKNQERVQIAGYFSAYNGLTELVVKEIRSSYNSSIAGPWAQICMKTTQAFARQTSQTLQTISGKVEDVRTVHTNTGRKMIVFRIGTDLCKAFGTVASFIEHNEGHQLELSAREGSFCGQKESSVDDVKMLDGKPVNITDDRSPEYVGN